MSRPVVIASLALALAMPVLTAPTTASASCAGRKLTGTVIGGLGGALVGNSISRGGGGAVIGGIGGAVLGHEIARSGCAKYHRTADYGSRDREYGQRTQTRHIYYDQRGEPIAPPANNETLAYGGPTPACRSEMRAVYDSRGGLVQTPVQVCDR